MAVFNLTIDRLAGGGDGVGRLPNGKVCFVPYAAPGDQIEVELTEEKKRFARGRIVQILNTGPDRIDPECDVFGQCGGCTWQHLSYPAQLAAKTALVQEHLTRFLNGDLPPIGEIVASPNPWQYRSRARFHMDHDKLGFFAANSNEIITIQDCPIADPELLPAARMQHQQLLERGIKRAELAFRSAHAETFDVAGCSLSVSPESFTQVNLAINNLLVRCVLDLLGTAPRRILDLYCGVGNMSLPAARLGHNVTGVESSKVAIADARENAARLELTHMTEFICADAGEWLRKYNGTAFETILLDPPRTGAAACLPHLPQPNSTDIIYVSCDLPTLTRDLNTLHESGYQTTHIQPFDMFPQTAHMELVAHLKPGPPNG